MDLNFSKEWYDKHLNDDEPEICTAVSPELILYAIGPDNCIIEKSELKELLRAFLIFDMTEDQHALGDLLFELNKLENKFGHLLDEPRA